MTRHDAVANSDVVRERIPALAYLAEAIGDPQVRNMGTMGGSCAFFDPAADYPPALVTADARFVLRSSEGHRTVSADDFFVDWYETALNEGELIESVVIPPAPSGSIGSYTKLARVSGDFAIASVALVMAMEKEVCSYLAVAVGACGPKPARSREGEADIIGGRLDNAAIARLTDALDALLDPVDDVRASAEYRRRVAPRMVRQAIHKAQKVLSEV